MDSSASVGVVLVLLRVITSLFLFLVSSVYAEHSPALQSPYFCFDQSPGSVCVLSVAYPLERASYSDDSCGYPGFVADCNDQSGGRPFINISNHIYHVLEVDYKSKYINLVDIDVEGSTGGCHQPKRNFSFPSSPSWVNYHFAIPINITIFYNCSGSVPVDAEKHLLCSKQDTNTPPSYAFYSYESTKGFDWYGNCAQNVVVPVRDYFGNYSEALKSGFWMGWSATDWCEDCERSGGRCWSSSIFNSTGCACSNDKSYNTTCPRQLTPPPHQGVPPTPSTASKSQHRKDGLSTGLKIGIDNAALVLLYLAARGASQIFFEWEEQKIRHSVFGDILWVEPREIY